MVEQVQQRSSVMTERERQLPVLERQRKAFHRDGVPTLEQRLDSIDRLRVAINDHEERLANAVSADFGHRSYYETVLGELTSVRTAMKLARIRLPKWMKPEKRTLDVAFLPGKGEIRMQPLGVVGIMAPWNFPYSTVFHPLVGALAAGNRAMVRPSEQAPRASQAIADLLAQAFSEDEVATVLGDMPASQAFASLPFDHLLFTGSSAVGAAVATAAAPNLVPVTLELGGKSPVVIGEDADLGAIMHNLAFGKTLNAGQGCICPDYVFVPEGRRDEFVLRFEQVIAEFYPTIRENPDYTAIINDRHYTRITSMVDEARNLGATEVVVNASGDHLPAAERKIAPTLLLDVTPEMRIMQEEIFGPVLPVMTYQHIDEAISFITSRPRPLALYLFTDDEDIQQRFLDDTISGGMSINATMLHKAQEVLPFGGVGASGSGSYHSDFGFRTFSHARAVYRHSRFVKSDTFGFPPHKRRSKVLTKLNRLNK